MPLHTAHIYFHYARGHYPRHVQQCHNVLTQLTDVHTNLDNTTQQHDGRSALHKAAALAAREAEECSQRAARAQLDAHSAAMNDEAAVQGAGGIATAHDLLAQEARHGRVVQAAVRRAMTRVQYVLLIDLFHQNQEEGMREEAAVAAEAVIAAAVEEKENKTRIDEAAETIQRLAHETQLARVAQLDATQAKIQADNDLAAVTIQAHLARTTQLHVALPLDSAQAQAQAQVAAATVEETEREKDRKSKIEDEVIGSVLADLSSQLEEEHALLKRVEAKVKSEAEAEAELKRQDQAAQKMAANEAKAMADLDMEAAVKIQAVIRGRNERLILNERRDTQRADARRWQQEHDEETQRNVIRSVLADVVIKVEVEAEVEMEREARSKAHHALALETEAHEKQEKHDKHEGLHSALPRVVPLAAQEAALAVSLAVPSADETEQQQLVRLEQESEDAMMQQQCNMLTKQVEEMEAAAAAAKEQLDLIHLVRRHKLAARELADAQEALLNEALKEQQQVLALPHRRGSLCLSLPPPPPCF